MHNLSSNIISQTFGTKVRMSQEVWMDSLRSQVESAFYYTLLNSVTAKFAAQCGMVKVIIESAYSSIFIQPKEFIQSLQTEWDFTSFEKTE